MAKSTTKKTSPVFWVGLLGVAIAAYVLTTPDDSKHPVVRPHTVVKKTDTSSDLILPEDYKASFVPVNLKPKDAFHPLVAKATVSDASKLIPTPLGGIPSFLTGGEGDWSYTGLAVLDGKQLALLESSKGDSVYLSVGERWKSATVRHIDTNSIQFSGPDGKPVTVVMGEKAKEDAAQDPKAANGGFAPATVSPPIRGAIGQLEVKPLPARSGTKGSEVSINGGNNAF